MSNMHKRQADRMLLSSRLLVAVSLILILLIAGGSVVLAQGDPAFVRRVRAIETDDLGITHPAGLAFSPAANAFLVVEAQGASGPRGLFPTITAITPVEDRVGELHLLVSAADPRNMTFDGQGNRLLLYQPTTDELMAVGAGSDGQLNPATLVSYDARPFGVESPQGMAVDPASGHLFILDRLGPQIVRIEPGLDGGFDDAVVTQVDLAQTDLSGLRGLAFNPANGHLYVLSSPQQALHELTQAGEVVATRDLSPFALVDPQSMVFAPSGDLTDDPALMNLYVADSGLDTGQDVQTTSQASGQIVELAFEPVEPLAIEADVTATLVNTIDTSVFDPPSPDPAGIAYIDHLSRLLMTDSEVDEMPIYEDANAFEMSLTGSLFRTGTTVSFSEEPSGVAYNPDNEHLFIADDNAKRIHEIRKGGDGLYFTSDDTRTSFDTRTFNSADPEGIAYDSWDDVLFIADGLSAEVYRVDPGSNGVFDGAPPAGDDEVMHFDTASLGLSDPGGITFDTENGHLYLIGRPKTLMLHVSYDLATNTASVVRTIDISAANAEMHGGLSTAPGSQNPGVMNLYLTDRGIDNGEDPNENDGKVYELYVPALEPDAAIVKTVQPAGAPAGATITYALNFGNAGGGIATGVVITDFIPVSVTVQSVVSSGVSIVNKGTPPNYVWEVQDLTPADEGEILITAEVSSSLTCGDSFVNTATIATTSDDTRPSNNQSEAAVAVDAGVSVSPHSDSDSANPGEAVTYSLDVTNNGACPDTFEVSVSGTDWTVDVPSTVGLASGASTSVDVTVHVPADAQCGTDTAIVTFASQYGDFVSDSSELVTTVNPVAAVTVDLSTPGFPGDPGAVVTHTLTVENLGNCADTFGFSTSGNAWTTTGPASGLELDAGQGVDVEVYVTVDPDAQCTDQDIATVRFTSANNGTVFGSSQLTTSANTVYGVDVTPSSAGLSGDPTEGVVYSLRVENTGNCADTLAFSSTGNAWSTTGPALGVPLNAGAHSHVDVTVTVDPAAECDEQDVATVAFTAGDGITFDSSILTTSANTVREVSILPATGGVAADPGTEVVYGLWVRNAGNCIDTLDASVSGTTWPVSLVDPVGPLNPGDYANVDVRMDVPSNAACGDEVMTVTYTSSDGITSDSSILTTTVNQVYGVTVTPSTAGLSGDPGDPVVYDLQVTNAGNCPDTFTFSATGDQWPASAQPASVELDADEQANVEVSVEVPSDAECGDQDSATVTFTSAGPGGASDSSNLTTAANTIWAVTVEPSSDSGSGSPGTGVVYNLWVTNEGNCTDTFVRSFGGGTWPASAVPSVGPLGPGEGGGMDVTVTVPACTTGGASDVMAVTLTSDHDGSVWDRSNLTTEADYVAPVAGDDEYTTWEDTPLVRGAPGVLWNDDDANCDYLTASLDSDASHGSVVLNLNGSFTYTPLPNYIGSDSFTYQVYDGALGDTATVSITVNSLGDDPIVEAGPDQSGIDEGQEVSFSGSFIDPARTLAAGELIHWDFGDGESATGTLTPVHTYFDNDVYAVTLTVTDTHGDAGQDSLLVTVANVDPTANAGPDQAAQPGELLSFSGSFTDPGLDDAHTVVWDLDDGTIINNVWTFDHAFVLPGDYTVTLTVTDDDGGVGIDTAIITVRYKVYLPLAFRASPQ